MATAIMTAFFDVFENIGSWITDYLTTLTSLFWTTTNEGAGSLTFFGVLAVMGLGISVIFLLLRVIQNFLHFRG